MKVLTSREFFHGPALLKSLRSGQSLVVTDKGKSSFVVTKAGQRPRRSLAELKARAKRICPEVQPKVNFTEAVRALKGR